MNIKDIKILKEVNIKYCLEKMNLLSVGFLLIVNNNEKLIGVISAGDLRRHLLNHGKKEDSIYQIMNKKFIFGKDSYSKYKLKQICLQNKIFILPIINDKKMPIGIYHLKNYVKSFKHLIPKIGIRCDASINDAMKKIDENGFELLIAVEGDGEFIGILTEVDLRVAIIDGADTTATINKYINKKCFRFNSEKKDHEIKDLLKKKGINKFILIPIIENKKVLDLRLFDVRDITSFEEIYLKEEPNIGYNHKKKILIVGGAGYIGSLVSRKLLSKGYKVRILDKMVFGNNSIKSIKDDPNFELIKGDYKHLETVTNAVKGVNAVIHLAGIVGDPACSLDAKYTMENNFFATIALANICKHYQINRFIFSSSCSVYGVGEEILTEESKLSPISLYAKDKIISENGILSLEDENFAPTILRLGTVFGWSPRMRFDLVANILTANAKINGKFKVFGGEQWRPFVHVNDVADAFVTMIKEPIKKIKGQKFNVGSNKNNFRIIDVGNLVKKVIPGSIMLIEKIECDKRDYNVDFQKIEKVTSFKAKKSLGWGIKEMVKKLEDEDIINILDKKYSNVKNAKEKLNIE